MGDRRGLATGQRNQTKRGDGPCGSTERHKHPPVGKKNTTKQSGVNEFHETWLKRLDTQPTGGTLTRKRRVARVAPEEFDDVS
jgi:hypothetical protein